MTSADDIFEQASSNIQRLGLREIPFTESPTDLQTETLQHIFTGREAELRKVFNFFQGRERRRILIYGRIGIGKSAFLLEVLSVLRRHRPEMLTTYTSLPSELDLATAALIALARAMPDDGWAQRQLYQMGIPTEREIKKGSTKIGGKFTILSGERGEEDLPITSPKYPTVSFDALLERAQEKYPQGVVIAIDDLDKQNPSRIRQLMHDAQGMLKGRAWFLLTAHPYGMTSDLLTSERGLFDLQQELKELDQPTTYQMLINYLSNARINNNSKDPEEPGSVLPFLPETAERFCQASLGKPRLFNRLGNIVLSTAAELQADVITPEVLEQGLKAAEPSLLEKARLNVQEERVRALLKQRGRLADDDITIAELEQLGFQSYSQLLPILERLEEADLAYRLDQSDAVAFAPIPLPPAD